MRSFFIHPTSRRRSKQLPDPSFNASRCPHHGTLHFLAAHISFKCSSLFEPLLFGPVEGLILKLWRWEAHDFRVEIEGQKVTTS